MMRNKGQNQSSNKFLKLISIPIKALSKARDFYVRSITGCAARTHYSTAATADMMPRSRSSSSVASRRSFYGGEGDDDYSELIRAASVRSMGHRNEIDMFLEEQQRRQRSRVAAATAARGGLPKSSSVGMARIEEEEDEGEGSLHQKKASDRLIYPRSRSYAVPQKTNF